MRYPFGTSKPKYSGETLSFSHDEIRYGLSLNGMPVEMVFRRHVEGEFGRARIQFKKGKKTYFGDADIVTFASLPCFDTFLYSIRKGKNQSIFQEGDNNLSRKQQKTAVLIKSTASKILGHLQSRDPDFKNMICNIEEHGVKVGGQLEKGLKLIFGYEG